MEMVILPLMASIIDEGANAGDMNHIYTVDFTWSSPCGSRTVCRCDGRWVRRQRVHRFREKSEKGHVREDSDLFLREH